MTSPITVAGFASMRALSSRNDERKGNDPGMKTGMGLFWGGAGCTVLEEYERAGPEVRRFGVKFLASVYADAHITGPAEMVRVVLQCAMPCGMPNSIPRTWDI